MSRETAPVESETEETSSSVLDHWRERYHVVALAGIMVFMLWVRIQSWNRFVRGEQILFSGNDAYYHFREISYVVHHWPFTMPFDPLSAFPYGTSQGQFGTLYDQLIATAALIVGLGSPDQNTIAMVSLFAPAVLGTLVAIPVYYVGRRLHNRITGVFAVLLLAILPGEFFRRSLVGFTDHHVAEVFFLTVSIFAIMVALSVAEREFPVYEQVLDRDWEGLRSPLTYSALAGVAVGLYIWVWPPAVILVGILGVFFAIALSADFLRGQSPDHVASVGIVSMVVVTLLVLPRIQTFGFETTRLSLLQATLALGVAGWCAFMAALARVWESRELPDPGYPAAAFGVILAGLAFLAVALPDVYNLILSNALRAFGFGQGTQALTIAEAQPTPGVDPFNASTLTGYLFREYGFAYVVALVTAAWLVGHAYFTEYRSEYVLLVVLTVFTFLMALTQRRFHYYLVVPVVLLTAWSFSRVISVTGAPSLTERLANIKAYQVFTLLAIVLLVLVPMFPPIAAASISESRQNNVPAFVVDAGRTGPSGGQWADTGDWMQTNTPDTGMEYYGRYDSTDDFEYPETAYGVVAWWDYGHWITVLSERMPHANPFQENARSASSFFQSRTEDRANAVLDALPSMQNRLDRMDEMTTDEIQAVVANQTAQQKGEDVRYVMIDDQTAAEKFLAVRRWADPPGSTYFTSRQYTIRTRTGERTRAVPIPSKQFEQTMLYKLYYDDATGLSHYRLVHESSRYSIVGGFIAGDRVRVRNSFRPSGWNNWTPNLAGLNANLSRAARANTTIGLGGNTYAYESSIEASLKTFERVPGATVTGQFENASNATVVVRLELETRPGRPFEYFQQTSTGPDGRFQVTVPYATDNAVGPADGGTDTNVTAVSDYSLFVQVPQSAFSNPLFASQLDRLVAENFTVSERAVYDGATVDLGTVAKPPVLRGNESSGNESGGNASDGDSGGSSDGGNGNESSESGSLTAGTPRTPQLASARGR